MDELKIYAQTMKGTERSNCRLCNESFIQSTVAYWIDIYDGAAPVCSKCATSHGLLQNRIGKYRDYLKSELGVIERLSKLKILQPTDEEIAIAKKGHH